MALPLAWLDGIEAAERWLATVSRVGRSRAGVEGESKCEEERVEQDISTATTRDGIRMCSRGTVVTDGVRSPSCHHVRCHARWRPG
jgi:hypothetical protein